MIDWIMVQGQVDCILALTPRHHPFGSKIKDRTQFEIELGYNTETFHKMKYLTFTEALQHCVSSVRLDFIQ